MRYTLLFFDFQLQFARRLAERLDLPLPDALLHYTTFSKTLEHRDWQEFAETVVRVPHATEWIYQYYLEQRLPDPTSEDTKYEGNPLFGCFTYRVRDTTIIRVHFMKNDGLSTHPLSRERMEARKDELCQMFSYIKQHIPAAQTVLGNSWMYHLEAYRRLYPPSYTAQLPMSDEAELQFLAFWGQCFDYAWNPKPAITNTILERLEHVTQPDQVRWCFPYQILQPQCPITDFYTYYGIE